MSALNDPKLESLLADQHARSRAQEPLTENYWRTRSGAWNGMEERDHAHYADKFVALEPDKAEFCYMLCRAIGARRVVEVGTSFGVSTLYLAAAVRDNGGGSVIATEYEAGKVRVARENFAAAGLAATIDLREGDVRETLKRIEGPVDFVLFDIWADCVGPVLHLLAPHLHTGSVICTDNSAGERARANYKELFNFVADPKNRLITQTLPFQGGFEMTVRV